MLFCDHIVSIDTIRFKFWQPVTQTSMLSSKKSHLIPCDEPVLSKMKRHYLLTYLIDPSHTKLFFNDIYCYSYCINTTVVS